MSYLHAILGGRGRACSCWEMRNNRAELKTRVQLREMAQAGALCPDRSWTATTQERRVRLAPSKGKKGRGKRCLMELRLHAGKNIPLSVREVILANHNSAEYKKLLIRSDFRGARCTAWQGPTNLMQRKSNRKHRFQSWSTTRQKAGWRAESRTKKGWFMLKTKIHEKHLRDLNTTKWQYSSSVASRLYRKSTTKQKCDRVR